MTYMWHFKVVFMLPHVVVTSGVNTNQLKVSIKNEDSRLNHLPKSNSLHQATRDVHGKIFKWYPLIFTWHKFYIVSVLLWPLMTKGEKFGQRYKGDESASMDMTWIKSERY